MSSVFVSGQGFNQRAWAVRFRSLADWTRQVTTSRASIRERLDDPRSQLARRVHTPALFVERADVPRTDRGRARAGARRRASLGGNALLAAGAFDFQTARARQAPGRPDGTGHRRRNGAVIGMEPARIQEPLQASEEGRRLDVANFTVQQTVIAGPTATCRVSSFEAAGVRPSSHSK
jgi:hypothetical protein